jgi:hypothetical protein
MFFTIAYPRFRIHAILRHGRLDENRKKSSCPLVSQPAPACLKPGGIILPYNILKRNDSGHPALRFACNRWVQASQLRRFSTFYETIKLDFVPREMLLSSLFLYLGKEGTHS